ncbi:MAG: AAA family ATPase [Candidatus Sabulitectum sp.]|nr:AAA family ATPase [Candidatus Sabulitectum sp.]
MHSSTLEAALAWAGRGFKVFPLVANGKIPVIPSFGTAATSDPGKIKAWWCDPVTGVEHQYNVGVLTSGFVVADVDVKKNKPGMQEYQDLGGHFETLVVKTPTGGYHCYFNGPNSSLAPMGLGLDIRSSNGYVVGPGSLIDGAAYTLHNDSGMAWVPAPIETKLRPPGKRSAHEPDAGVEYDTPNGIHTATAWLSASAPLAFEGLGGDTITYQVACRLVRDYALTEETAFHLLVNHWNDRCGPPWDADDLWSKVENAAAYSVGSLGGAKPETLFASVELPAPEVEPLDLGATFGNARDLQSIPPRPWLIPRLLMRRAITLLPAAGSSGKSTLALVLAAHLAVGKSMGKYVVKAPTKTVIYNAEDDLDEQSRRLYAVCQAYKFDYPKVRAQVMLLTNDHVALNLAFVTQRQTVANEPHVKALIHLASDPEVGLLILDPLVEVHDCDEQGNSEMRFVMATLRRIAREANVAMLVPHHISKPSGGGGVSRAGSPDVARGAGAIVNSARIVVTLFTATDKDREEFGIPEEAKGSYVRLDDAKLNMSLADANSTWFKKEGVKLYNGDEVGVLALHNMHSNEDTQKRFMSDVLALALVSESSATIGMRRAVLALQSEDPLYDRMTEPAVRAKIERAFRAGYATPHGRVVCKRVTEGNKDKVFIVLE